MAIPMHHLRRHSSSYYMPLWPNQQNGLIQRLGPKRVAYGCLGLVLFIALYSTHRYYTITYPAQLIPPSEYQSTLFAAIEASFPRNMQQQLKHTITTAPSSALDTSIPNQVFQTDKSPPDPSDSKTWDENGFHRIFLNDTAALDWVESHFGESDITKSYKALPKPILKADMLRYLVLLAEGGVYSDADTRALKPLTRWADSAKDWNVEKAPPQPVRVIVSVEGDFHVWRDPASISEGIGLTKTGRHRGLQFVQWTIAAAPHHPILLDAVRRIVETTTVAKAWGITQTRHIQALEAEGKRGQATSLRQAKKPWELDAKGDPLSIQEWTGPAVFTDAVLSYLLNTAGIREGDLYRLEHPLRVGDVLVLPIDGYNPRPNNLSNPMACVIHLFRGSWKGSKFFPRRMSLRRSR